MWWFALAGAQSVVLNVGVHVDAGTVSDIAVDGAAGQCTVAPSALVCPATSPVTFRWGPGGAAWELTGDTTLEPGETGVAWVLAPDADRQDVIERMQARDLTPREITAFFHPTEEGPPPVPSRGMVEGLVALTDHDDERIRRKAVDALFIWTWRSSLGPLPPTSPVPVPPGTLTRLAQDEDPGVRRRVSAIIRHMRPSHLSDEAEEVLVTLSDDKRAGVRAQAIRASGRGHLADATTPSDAWVRAMIQLGEEGTSGRAAAGTLAYLSTVVEPSAVVDPVAAVEKTLLHHPEQAWKVWSRWKEHVPYRSDWGLLLLRDTYHLSPGLLRHWASEDPEALGATLTRWEPSAPHSDRYRTVSRHLERVRHRAIRDVVDVD